MKFEFDTAHSRVGMESAKWDAIGPNPAQGVVPLSVADMELLSPPEIIEELKSTAEFGMWGYTWWGQRYADAVKHWLSTRHGWDIQKDWIIQTNGVVQTLYASVRAFTQPGDQVILFPPVYYPFYRVIRNTGRRAVYHPLTERNGIYTVDLEQFEQTIVAQRPKLFLLCSPHNPVGRVWREEELRGMLACCQRHQVQVVSDEIHHDILMPGHRHCSATRLWQGEGKPITFFSSSKTFNLAGMKNSILVLPEEAQREQFDAFQRKLGISEGSTLDYVAVTAAFLGGKEWLWNSPASQQ